MAKPSGLIDGTASTSCSDDERDADRYGSDETSLRIILDAHTRQGKLDLCAGVRFEVNLFYMCRLYALFCVYRFICTLRSFSCLTHERFVFFRGDC